MCVNTRLWHEYGIFLPPIMIILIFLVLIPDLVSISATVWAETGDFRDNGHTTMANVANSLDINQLHFQSSTNIRNTKNRDRKSDGTYLHSLH